LRRTTVFRELTPVKIEGLLEGMRDGKTPALAKAISLVENARDGYEEILSALHPALGRAHRVGITGPPGAGKSTLAECLVNGYRRSGKTVAVVAVDPTSPFSGGALLGDRIRMETVTLDPGVFIRSMAARGATGGLATKTLEVCDLLDAFGFDRIIIETVGVGQSELAIAATADTAALVLVPESGDGIQVLKAGVMEIADLYVVNKADRPGADRLIQEVQMMLGLRRGHAVRHSAHHRSQSEMGESTHNDAPVGVWEPSTLTTVATRGEGIEDLIDSLDAHWDYLKDSGKLYERRRNRMERHTKDVVGRMLDEMVWQHCAGEQILIERVDEIVEGTKSPYRVAHEIVDCLRQGEHTDDR
jgi:LAO/AO transport system kinase